MYEEALTHLYNLIKKDANARFFHNACEMYEKVGRGAFFLIYTQPEQVFTHTGIVPARYLPIEVIEVEEEHPEDIVEACQTYNPKTQFIMVFEIGQKNDLDKNVVQNILIVDYIGKKEEKLQEETSFSLYEFEHRLENKKSVRCDNCNQRRRLENMMLDPIIQRLAYCNTHCYEDGLRKGDGKIIAWYLKNKDVFNIETDIQRGPKINLQEQA